MRTQEQSVFKKVIRSPMSVFGITLSTANLDAVLSVGNRLIMSSSTPQSVQEILDEWVCRLTNAPGYTGY